MKKLKYLIPSLLLLMSCNSDDKSKETLSTADKAQAQQVLDAATVLNFPGLSLTVMTDDDNYTIVSGKAMLGATSMAPTTIQYMQSISKTFTAAAILKLEEQGFLSLDDRMNEYLAPEICNNITNGNDITIRQLLNMTSGISDYLEHPEFINDALTGELPMPSSQVLSYVYGQPAHFPPGTSAAYSNINYHLLALVIDTITEEHHGNYITDNIIVPAGLNSTYYLPTPVYNAPIVGTATSYMPDGIEFTDITALQFGLTKTFIGDDGIVSTTKDIAIFYEKLLAGKIVSAASVTQMKTPVMLNNEPYYGMGLYYYTTPGNAVGVGHSGSGAGAAAEAYHFKAKGITVVLATNTGTLTDEAKTEKFAELYKSLCSILIDEN